MMLVIILNLVLLTILGVAFRQMNSSVNIETTRLQQLQRDTGSVQALAVALSLLETGLPPAKSFTGGLTLPTASGPQTYVITFSLVGTTGTAYSVTAAPLQDNQVVQALPSTFAKLN
jgi:hypothetical protein